MQKYKKYSYLCKNFFMMEITAVIITQNEERNIGRCLASLEGVADEIVVVDSGSTDATAEICASHGNAGGAPVVFHFHPWEGYDLQKNYAHTLARHSWILSIDADEALSPRLRESLLALKGTEPQPSAIYAVNRLTYYCGSPIRHCGWYPERKERLFRKDYAMWDGIVHEELRPTNPQSPKPNAQLLKGDLLHYPYNTPDDLKRKYDKYASLMAEKYRARGKKATTLDCRLRPLWTFFRNYILLLGFLDGRNGWYICKMSAHYTKQKYQLLKTPASPSQS